MRSTNLGLLVFSVIMLGGLGLLAGCGEDNATGSGDVYTPESQTVDLEDSFGGFLAVDEAPAFGEPALAASLDEEEVLEDGYAGLSRRERERAREMEEHPRCAMYSLTILWGNLASPEDEVIPLPPDGEILWNGSLSIREGAIRLLSVIDFERGEDLILERTGRDSLAWVSITRDFMDGLRVLVIVPPDSTGTVPPRELTLALNDFRRVLSTDEMSDFGEVIPIDETTRISLRSFLVDPRGRVHGSCHGLWGWAEGDSLGHFEGAWVRYDGIGVGFMRGHYGINEDGEQVFFGKFISPQGRFGGFVRGGWAVVEPGDPTGGPGPHEDSVPVEIGRFSGEWVDAHGAAIGEVKGHWSRRVEGKGIFNGSWHGNRVIPMP